MVRRAVEELGLVAADTWMVGDSWADVAAGRSVGCRTLLVGHEWLLGALLPPGRRPETVAPDLAAGIEAILEDLRVTEDRRERGRAQPPEPGQNGSGADDGGRRDRERAISRPWRAAAPERATPTRLTRPARRADRAVP